MMIWWPWDCWQYLAIVLRWLFTWSKGQGFSPGTHIQEVCWASTQDAQKVLGDLARKSGKFFMEIQIFGELPPNYCGCSRMRSYVTSTTQCFIITWLSLQCLLKHQDPLEEKNKKQSATGMKLPGLDYISKSPWWTWQVQHHWPCMQHFHPWRSAWRTLQVELQHLNTRH